MAACIITTLITSRVMKENIYTLKLVRRGINLASGREINVLKTLRVSGVMSRNAVILRPQTPLGGIIETATQSPQSCFYVVEEDGRLVGTISGEELRGALLEAGALGDLILAADLVREDLPVLLPEQDLDSVMRIFGGRNQEELPVVDGPGRRFLGSISRGQLLESYNRELRKRDMVSGMVADLAGSEHEAIFLGGGHWMREVSASGSFEGKCLKDLDLRRQYGVQVVLVRRPASKREDGWTDLVPGPDTEIRLGDQMVVIGSQLALDRLRGV